MTAYLISLSIDRPGRGRDVGRAVMSAEIIAFVPRRDRDRAPSGIPAMAFRSRAVPDDLVMDHVDSELCEYAAPDGRET